MFERFTERARKVILQARDEAIRLGHNCVGTEHLLLGLIRDGDGIAVAILKKLNVNTAAVEAEIETIVAAGREVSADREIPFTAGARKVLEYALYEARSLNHASIGCEHLLLGLIREGEGIASRVLRGCGVSVAAAKAEALELLGEKPHQTTLGGPRLTFEGFTERARKVIILAREEAIRLGHNFVGPEHLLLGQIRDGDGVAVATLKKLHVDIAAVKAEIEKIVAVGNESA